MTAVPDAFAPVAAQLGDAKAAQMAAHWALVCHGQTQQNLTGIKDTERAVWLHYMDALAALPLWPEGSDLLDIGSGAGFPGLVLAIARPQAHVTLLEPRRLRAAFLQHAVAELGLTNVTVRVGRLETQVPTAVGCVSMRAVYARDAQLEAVVPWLLPAGVLLVFRSGDSDQGPPARHLRRLHITPYALPGAVSARRIDSWQLRAQGRRVP